VAARDGVDFARDADEDGTLRGLHLVLDMVVDVQQLVGGHEHPAGRRVRRTLGLPRACCTCPCAVQPSRTLPTRPLPKGLTCLDGLCARSGFEQSADRRFRDNGPSTGCVISSAHESHAAARSRADVGDGRYGTVGTVTHATSTGARGRTRSRERLALAGPAPELTATFVAVSRCPAAAVARALRKRNKVDVPRPLGLQSRTDGDYRSHSII